MRIDPEQHTIGTDTGEEISRRLRTAQTRPLREDSIDTSRIVARSSAGFS